VKISDLPLASGENDASEVEINNAGASQRMPLSRLSDVLMSTTGFLARTGSNTRATRSIVGSAPVVVTNGDGAAGNPTVAVAKATVAEAEAGAGTGLMDATLTAAAIAALASGGDGGGWAPFNGTTGIFWSFANDGQTGTIVTPDFEDGWEYMIELRRYSPNRQATRMRAHPVNVRVEFQGVATLTRPVPLVPSTNTSAVSSDDNSVAAIFAQYGPPIPANTPYDLLFSTIAPRVLRRVHTLRREYLVRGNIALNSDPPAIDNPAQWAVGNGDTSSRIRRLHISFGLANTQFNGGVARLYRRPASLV
jgi:hypothetical protein